jgi:hypothetical protein
MRSAQFQVLYIWFSSGVIWVQYETHTLFYWVGQEMRFSKILEGFLGWEVLYGSTIDRWRDVQLSSLIIILPIPSGYAHGIMGDPTNARFGLL